MALNFVPQISLDTILLFIATLLIAAATFLMYGATRKVAAATKTVSDTSIKPMVFSWLREPEKGVGIYVQNAGFRHAWNRKINCVTSAGATQYGFTRLFPCQTYEYPIAGQPELKIARTDQELIVQIEYEDMNRKKYEDVRTLSLTR